VLDVNMPSIGGFDVLSQIRRTDTVPVIMVTGRAGETDRVLGLELGADDYVVKPFSPRELASRVRAVLRRSTIARRNAEHGQALAENDDRLDFGHISIDLGAREVTILGSVVDLTTREFDLLAFLARSPRRVFSRQQLLERVWASAAGWQDAATVTEHVRRIRHKTEAAGAPEHWIRTVRGVGYAFEP